MTDIALVVLPGAYLASVGALTDCYFLARDRIARIFSAPDGTDMETRLRIFVPDKAALPQDLGIGAWDRIDFDSSEQYAMIWLPAFRVVGSRAMRDRITDNAPLIRWLQRQHAGGAIIGASGGAALVLVAAGLTAHMRVPVARALQPLVRAMYPRQRLETAMSIIDHGTILIASGLGHDLRLIVRIMERLFSPAIARWLSSVTGIDDDEIELSEDRLVLRAQLWIEQRFAEPVDLAQLATTLSTSAATLNRRFRETLGLSPSSYVQQLRFNAAIRLLDKSDHSIERIAEIVGYSDSRLFRAMFLRRAGMTASQWRRQKRSRP